MFSRCWFGRLCTESCGVSIRQVECQEIRYKCTLWKDSSCEVIRRTEDDVSRDTDAPWDPHDCHLTITFSHNSFDGGNIFILSPHLVYSTSSSLRPVRSPTSPSPYPRLLSQQPLRMFPRAKDGLFGSTEDVVCSAVRHSCAQDPRTPRRDADYHRMSSTRVPRVHHPPRFRKRGQHPLTR